MLKSKSIEAHCLCSFPFIRTYLHYQSVSSWNNANCPVNHVFIQLYLLMLTSSNKYISIQIKFHLPKGNTTDTDPIYGQQAADTALLHWDDNRDNGRYGSFAYCACLTASFSFTHIFVKISVVSQTWWLFSHPPYCTSMTYCHEPSSNPTSTCGNRWPEGQPSIII